MVMLYAVHNNFLKSKRIQSRFIVGFMCSYLFPTICDVLILLKLQN